MSETKNENPILELDGGNGIMFFVELLTRAEKEATVRFYDSRRGTEDLPGGRKGQFTGASYYVSTLLEGEEDENRGLCLHGGVPAWNIVPSAFAKVRAWLRENTESEEPEEAAPNENCLEGFKCPECGSLGPFNIDVSVCALTKVYDSGHEPPEGDSEWSDHSTCECCACGHDGQVGNFNGSHEGTLEETTVICISKEGKLLWWSGWAVSDDDARAQASEFLEIDVSECPEYRILVGPVDKDRYNRETCKGFDPQLKVVVLGADEADKPAPDLGE